MPRLKLTDAAVQKLTAPKGGRVEYFDTLLPGFALRVSGATKSAPDGSRSWVVFYRVTGRKKVRRFTIGSYPAMKLIDAREAARVALRAAAEGGDPSADKREARAREPDTVDRVVEEFMRRHMEGKERAPSYIAGTQGLFDNHILPRWRDREIQTITRRDVIELLDAIVDAGKPIAANRALAAIRKLFNWAMQRGIIEATPVALIEKPGSETSRQRTLTDEELAELWPAFRALGYPFGQFFQLTLVTGQRRDEVATMRRAAIDGSAALWALGAEETKAGRAHLVPLSPMALTTRAACPNLGDFVFTTRDNRPVSGYSKAKIRLDAIVAERREKAGLAPFEPWTIHDLRRTVGTGLGRLGFSRFIISRVLNHADRSVTGIYDRHEYLAEKREALEAWSRHLFTLLRPKEQAA